MADTAVAITAGSGTNIDTRTEATNGNHRQVIVIGDPATNAAVATVKDASTGAAATTDIALVVTLRDANVNGQATNANSAPITVSSNQTFSGQNQTIPTNQFVMGGQYNASPTTVTTGNVTPLQLTSGGLLKVDNTANTQPVSETNLTKFGTGYYFTQAAGTGPTTIQSSTGATGDYLSGVLVVPATTSPGAITITDNATAITVFAGGASSVSNLVPFFIPLGAVSRSGAWKITTGSNVSAVAIGKFS